MHKEEQEVGGVGGGKELCASQCKSQSTQSVYSMGGGVEQRYERGK